MLVLGVTITGPDLLAVSDRDRILQAMAECCAERGYAATALEHVLERAEVSRDSFDSHFSDKEDCATAAFNKLVSEAMLTISTTSADDLSASERRAVEVKALLELITARPAFVRLALIDARQGGTQQMHQAYESAARVLALMMERGQWDESGQRPASSLARASLGGVEALVRRELSAGRAESLPSVLESFVYAALVPFVGQREALRQAREATDGVAEEG
jgi:AcrR family transcriptional regulator